MEADVAECIRVGRMVADNLGLLCWWSKKDRNHENHLLGFDTCYLWSKRNNGVFKHCKSTLGAKGLRVMGD